MVQEQEHNSQFIEQILGALFQPQDLLKEHIMRSRSGQNGAFSQFMDEMPGGFFIYRADEGEEILYVNQGMLRIFLCDTVEEFRKLTGGSFRGLVHPEDLDRVEASIEEQIAASHYDLDYVEYRVRRKDGEIRWIEDYGHFVRNQVIGNIFYVFIGDATDKRERLLREKTDFQKESREKEKSLQQLIEKYDTERSLVNKEYLRQMEVIEGLSSDYEGICYLDLDRDRIIPYRLSVRTSRIFRDLSDEEPYSWYNDRYVAMWVHPGDREMVASAIAPEHIREMLSANKTYYFNYRVVVDGELQYLQLRYVSVGKQAGVCQAVMGYRRVDDEIRQQMEQQSLLAEALSKANLAIASKDTFLSNISHDMRTPLNAIFGFTSLAKMSVEQPEEIVGYLEQVEKSSRQLLEMIEKVLEVSSAATTSRVSEMECDLKEAAQKVYDFLLPQAREKGIDFTLDCSGLRHKDVFSDPEKLHQMILYLTNNAVTYTNTGGAVVLTIEEGEELTNHYADYRLTVRDTGVGIEPEFLDKIFEPFTREKNSTISGIHSIGLGLTIAKNIVDMMGGTMKVQSKVGEGSVFTVTLRLRHQIWDSLASWGMRASPRKKEEKQQAAMNLLLVEDNELNRDIEAELLSRLGFKVDAVESGQQALAKMRGAAPGSYELIIMDLQMPGMDGWETSAAIRALPDPALAGIPIIAISASALDNEEDKKKTEDCGINEHLLKPIDLPVLLRAMEKVTGKRIRPKKGSRSI